MGRMWCSRVRQAECPPFEGDVTTALCQGAKFASGTFTVALQAASEQERKQACARQRDLTVLMERIKSFAIPLLKIFRVSRS